MKRKYCIPVTLLLLSLSFCFGNDIESGDFILGSRVEVERIRNGGGGEIGFVIFGSPGVRSLIVFQVSGYGGASGGMGELAAKLTFGGVSQERYYTYGLLRGGVCFTGEPHPAWDLSGGGGFELFFSPRNSFYLEMGGGVNWFESMFEEEEGFGGYAFVSPGFRYYF
ncbi:MAG: hypothetical protein JXB03_09835 [Spirochaetales bacterium]|nr:hypothetical protein [Spirochaetales bacterium]